MAALWLAGFEDDEEQLQCGELCVVEIFGRSVDDGSCEVGLGIKAFRDPALSQDFAAPRLAIDPADVHTYAVDWEPDAITWYVDGVKQHEFTNRPAIAATPMYLIANLQVGGWPGRPTGETPFPATYEVDYVRVWQH